MPDADALSKFYADVVPIVVTHNPDESILLSSLNALLGQVKTLLIVDNDSSSNSKEWLCGLELKWPGRLRLLTLEPNQGLGEAYNVGIAVALNMEAVFVLLMDQDSVAEPGMVNALRNAYAELLSQGKQVGAVGTCYRDNKTAHVSSFVRVTRFGFARLDCGSVNDLARADFLISSGSLISIKTLDQVGGMDKSLFIDHVDTEWCFRAQSKGFEIYGVCAAIMHHSLGDRRIRIWWGRWRTIPIHQPFRYYYMFRNSVLLWRRPYMPPRWKRADKLRLLYCFLFFGVLSPSRIANLRMMLRGLVDGYKGKTGKLAI